MIIEQKIILVVGYIDLDAAENQIVKQRQNKNLPNSGKMNKEYQQPWHTGPEDVSGT